MDAARADKGLSRYFEQMPWPIALLEGPSHCLSAANSIFRKMFLSDRSDYFGHPISELLPEAQAQGYTDLLDAVYKTGETQEGKEAYFTFADASGASKSYYLNFSYSPFRNESQEIIGVLASIYDVTSEVRSRQGAEKSAEVSFLEQQKLEAVLSNAPVGIAVLNSKELRFERVNQKFRELVSPRDYIGRKWEDVYAENRDRALPELLRSVIDSGQPWSAQEMTARVERAPGQIEDRIYDYNLVPLLNPSGQVNSILVQCKDVTEQVANSRIQYENERELVDILESMSDSFFAVDKDWTITRVNEHYVRATIYPRKEQIGANLLDLFVSNPAYEDSIYWRAYQKAMADRVYVGFEDFYEPLDLYTEVRLYPKADGGLAVFFTDISERKNNERKLAFERHQLESIFHLSPAAMALWHGPDFIFERVNPEYQKIFPRTKLLGQSLFEVIPELRDQIFHKALLRVYETGIPFVGHEVPTVLRRDPNGPLETIYYDFTYARLVDGEGKPYGVYDHAIDVTDRVRARMELEKAKLEAEQANQTKSAFLANMSHEIRTPLGAILGFAELLKDNRNSQDENSRFLEIILRNGKTLTRIIDDILDLAKVESGKLETEEVSMDLLKLTEEVIDLFREKAREKSIRLTIRSDEAFPKEIYSDPTRIRQILINILGNAVKFTDTGEVRLSLRAFPRDEKTAIELLVEDTGVGIDKEQQERLFQPFVQADNTTSRKYGGTGLGLVLSLRLARALGGSIEILRSIPGEGSTFRVNFLARLPSREGSVVTRLAASNAPSETKEPVKDKSLQGVSVLVADDSIDNLFLARRVLMKNGAVVATVNNGKEALDAALSGDFDVILMDIQMPVMDGYEATRALRSVGYRKPILALTAHAMAEEVARTEAAGCDAHLTKPLDQVELVRTIEKHLRTLSP
jgi:signal transduction histidine kinase